MYTPTSNEKCLNSKNFCYFYSVLLSTFCTFETGALISEFCNRSNSIIAGFFSSKKTDIVFDTTHEGAFFTHLKNYKTVEKCSFHV